MLTQQGRELPGEAVRVGVHQAQGVLALELGQRLDQLGQLGTDVTPPGRGVLGHQHEFAHAGVDQLAPLRAQARHRLGSVRAADGGNRTKTTGMVAAVGDAQVRIGPRRGEQARLVPGRFAQPARREIAGHRRAAAEVANGAREGLVVGDLGEEVDLRKALLEGVLEALDQTTRDDNSRQLAAALPRDQGADRRLGLLPGRTDEGAGVEHGHVGVLDGARDPTALFGHPREDQLGVDQVAGTTQVNQRDDRHTEIVAAFSAHSSAESRTSRVLPPM